MYTLQRIADLISRPMDCTYGQHNTQSSNEIKYKYPTFTLRIGYVTINY